MSGKETWFQGSMKLLVLPHSAILSSGVELLSSIWPNLPAKPIKSDILVDLESIKFNPKSHRFIILVFYF